jgi:polysaccharide biosynthesis transport protein
MRALWLAFPNQDRSVADRFQGGGSDAVDTRRYLAAVRRDLPLIGALAGGLLIFAVALSLVLPKTYSASARVGFDLNSTSGTDATTMERVIATQQELVTRVIVIEAARQELEDEGINVGQTILQDATTAQAVFGANLMEIKSTSDQPRLAAAYANAVADAYIKNYAGAQQASLDTQIRNLESSIADAPSADLRAQLRIQQQDLYAQRSATASQVTFAKAATIPGSPDSPKPVRNGILALFVGGFLGVLLALLRDQLRPRFTSQRDLGQFLEQPVVATIPEFGRRLGVRAAPATMRVEQEAYQSLTAALRLALPPNQPNVLMLTSSMHAEGKTTVATRAARLLAASGHRTLLVSGDLRWPRLDALLGVEDKPGLSDLLAAEAQSGVSMEQIEAAIISGEGRDRTSGAADVLPSGNLSSDAARLLSIGSVEPLFEKIRRLGYTYVIVDSTPLLGLADARLIARGCDRVLAIARLERISVPAALDFRDELGRLGVPVLGVVVIGGVSEASPYYSGVKFVSPAAAAEPQGTPRIQARD